MSNDRSDEPFLSRWSRQKRSDAKPAPPLEPVQAEDPPLDLATLPKIDELTADSDIAAFMQKGVPEALRQLALRRIWSLDPAIRDFVEVAENQWDFNAQGGIYGLFQELAPDTDVSVWMAQATSSLTPAPSVAPVDEPVALAAGREVDLAQGATDEKLTNPKSETIIDPIRQSEANIAETGKSVATGGASSEVSERLVYANFLPIAKRRRHGGAAPE